jgi:hypothetical protein
MTKSSYLSVIGLMLLGVLAAAEAQTKPPDGAIVESAPCAAPAKTTYEQYLRAQRASLEEEVKVAASQGYKVNYLDNFDRFVLSREEFERRQSFGDYECQKIKYISDGLETHSLCWWLASGAAGGSYGGCLSLRPAPYVPWRSGNHAGHLALASVVRCGHRERRADRYPCRPYCLGGTVHRGTCSRLSEVLLSCSLSPLAIHMVGPWQGCLTRRGSGLASLAAELHVVMPLRGAV